MKALAQRLWHSPTVMTWGSLASRLLGVTLVLPLVLVKFAPPEVVIWQLFIALYTMQMLFDFGLAPTFSRLLSYVRGGARMEDLANMRQQAKLAPVALRAADPHVLAHVFSAQRWLYARISGGVMLLFLVLGTLALINPISQVADAHEAWTCWAVVLATSVFGFWGNGFAAALQGMDHIAVARRWEIAFALGQITSATCVLLADGGLLALVIANQIWLVLGAIRNRMLLRRLHPELFAQPAQAHRDVLAVLWPAAWRSGIGVLMSQGIIQASGLIYGQLAAPAEVASYMLALRFVTMISQFSQAPFYSKLPLLAQLQAQGQTQQQLDVASRGMRLSHWVFVMGAVGVAIAADVALRLIGSHTPFVSPTMWLLVCAAFFAERLGAMYLQLYSTTNHIVWHIANGVTGLLMLGFGVVLYPIIGIVAFPMAMLAAYLGFYTWYAIRLSAKAFQFRWLSFERHCAMAPAAAATVCAVLYHYALPGS